MAFCPNCEAEYKQGITVCADCGLELVPELTSRTRVHDVEKGEPVMLQSFKTSTEAQLVSDLLTQNGIRSFVEGGEFSAFPGAFTGDIVVMVDERDLGRAVEIYEAFFTPQTAPAKKEQQEGAE